MAELKAIFGTMLRRARLERGYSQVVLAEKVGLSLETIAKLERGVSGAKFETVDRLAKVLDLPATALFGIDASTDPHGRLQSLMLTLSRLDEDQLAWIETLIECALDKPK